MHFSPYSHFADIFVNDMKLLFFLSMVEAVFHIIGVKDDRELFFQNIIL